MLELLEDWGAFLELSLYQEGIIHLLGGEAKIMQTTIITREEEVLGKHMLPQHASRIGFRLTAFSDSLPFHEEHLRRFAIHTHLRALQWINLHQDEVTFITLE